MKIKVETTVKKTKEVEIEFPYYTKSICYYYKIVDEETVIQVCDSLFNTSIGFSYISLAIEEKQTTESVFNKAYNKVLNQISKHI